MLKQQYIDLIEEHNRKRERINEQSQLRSLQEQFRHSLVYYFSGTYGIEPYNDAELQALLARHIQEEEIRSAILEKVKEEQGKVRVTP